MKKVALAGSLSSFLGAIAVTTHPNLKDAHDLAEQAIRHVQLAQQAARGVDLGGTLRKP